MRSIDSGNSVVPFDIFITTAREELKLTQKQFAAILGVSLSALRNYEHKREYPSTEHLIRFILSDTQRRVAFIEERKLVKPIK